MSSTLLIANVANLFRFVTLTDFDSKHYSSHFCIKFFISTHYFGYDWIITIIKDSKHELSTINMLYSLRKNYHITPLHLYHPPRPPPHNAATSPQRTLSPVTKVAVVETFDCSWKGRTKQVTSLL